MNYKKPILAGLLIILLLGLTGCKENKENTDSKTKAEIEIPMILTVNPTTGKKNEEELVNAFNEAYKGIYHMDVEWIMETEEEYRKNLKRLNVTDKLPAIITDLRMLPSFYEMMVQEGRLENLSPYMKADKDWQDMVEPAVMEACSEPDGSVYLAPISTAMFSCSGVFWNRQLFEEAGIREFPATWEDFWACCEQLKDSGITPLALHTEGTAWAPMLLATAELADSKEGAAFMNELFPDSYQNKNGLRMADTLKRLFAYTTEDALHTDFDVAYRNFASGKSAMLPNGYWMIEQIPEDFAGNVRFSVFPGNKLISSPETFGWAVVSSYSDEVKKGAVQFLKFRTMFNQQEKEAFLEGNTDKDNQMLADYIAAYNSGPQMVPNYQVKWNSVLQEETLGEYLPKLSKGQIGSEEFTRMEDDSIRQFEEER
ncbi:extracellular solute-binding protein [Bariatricus massiliensis]|nr:extracellular solute-binding protein [Bariatricus massiliensis]MCB7305829.1 extracellular solute-binding protein [Bariatricus massiliensis]MCB7376418.1 extracellular solute-binding protein [Bariatricus massiliensis]MCB7413145.1 extracellular solute-binding protein [Bariatricus massiliensis]MCQ5255040.1 extracellular solute-binding protein [Bariatricus massiliensis]